MSLESSRMYVTVYIHTVERIWLTCCVKVFYFEQELHTGGTSWMELERVDVATCVFPVHYDVYSVHIHGRSHVDEAIFGCGVVYHHRSILIVAIHSCRKIRDCRQQVGLVPAARKFVVAIAYVLRQRRLR